MNGTSGDGLLRGGIEAGVPERGDGKLRTGKSSK
jgi:hypothetical protein